MKYIALIISIITCLSMANLTAKITVFNYSPYPIAVKVWFDGGTEDFPKGIINKVDKKPFETAKGIAPTKSETRTKDAAQIKRKWSAWAKIEGQWTPIKEIEQKKWVRGGAFVKAWVMMAVEPETGTNIFDIVVGGN